MMVEPLNDEFPSLSAGSVLGFPAHEGRAGALGEVHARPHPLIDAPRILIQLSFMTDGGSGVDQAVLAELSRRLGIAAPDRQARHHAMKWGLGSLRWERHTEFSTYLWEGPLQENGRALGDSPFGNGFSPPGTVISGIRLEIRAWDAASESLISGFDPTSLCYSLVEGGKAAVVTDFRQDGDGLTRILVLDRGLNPARRGALSQRLIDIETYRTLAMLGLPLAQALSARVRRIEDRLAVITREMKAPETRRSPVLLADLTELAAELEADAAASLYRFGASRAYDGIVRERLKALDEELAGPRQLGGVSGEAGGARHAHLPFGRGAPGQPVAQADPRHDVVAHMDRRRGREPESRPARLHEQPRQASASSAADGGGPVGRRRILLYRRPHWLPRQGQFALRRRDQARTGDRIGCSRRDPRRLVDGAAGEEQTFGTESGWRIAVRPVSN